MLLSAGSCRAVSPCRLAGWRMTPPVLVVVAVRLPSRPSTLRVSVPVAVSDGGAGQGGGAAEGVVGVAAGHQPVGAVVGVGRGGGPAGGAVRADGGGGGGEGLAVGVLVEGVGAGGAHRVGGGVLHLRQASGLVVGVGLGGCDARGAGVGGPLALGGLGDAVGEQDGAVAVAGVGAAGGGAVRVLGLGHGVTAWRRLLVQFAVGVVAGDEGARDRVGHRRGQTAGIDGCVVSVGGGRRRALAHLDGPVQRVVLGGGDRPVRVGVRHQAAELCSASFRTVGREAGHASRAAPPVSCNRPSAGAATQSERWVYGPRVSRGSLCLPGRSNVIYTTSIGWER
ncbi:hypothetical protein STEPF1_02697 [Streptomyces sp. F-1]|nr:hypothetical protein STEPF1_02697 [Streptomyces sp. F-1]